MSNIKKQTLKRALVMLNAIGATYAVIEEDGTKHGDLEVTEKKKRGSKYGYGEMSSYVKQYLQPMGVSDVCEIPFGKYEAEEVRSAAVSWAHYHWGAGCATTGTSKQNKTVEVLRIA